MKQCFRCDSPRIPSSAYCRIHATEMMREWRTKNKEHSLEIGRRSDIKRRLEQPEKMRAKRRDNRRRVAAHKPLVARAQYLRKYRSMRERALERLGISCNCCGESLRTMLHIDHIHNDGNIERAGKRGCSSSVARRVLRSINPHARYQILCASCNHSKARNDGVCEHKTGNMDRLTRFIQRFDARPFSA